MFSRKQDKTYFSRGLSRPNLGTIRRRTFWTWTTAKRPPISTRRQRIRKRTRHSPTKWPRTQTASSRSWRRIWADIASHLERPLLLK